MAQTIREGRVGDSVTPVSSMRLPVHTVAVCLILACYACGRVLQVVHGPPAITALVAMEVFSAFALALVDGARAWGMRGILVFAAICTVVGNVVENIGVATGFPYGRYQFLAIMGPNLLRCSGAAGPGIHRHGLCIVDAGFGAGRARLGSRIAAAHARGSVCSRRFS